MNEDVTKNNFYNSFLTKNQKPEKKDIFINIYYIFNCYVFILQ